jgi:DNA-binding LytR/AlgR family response regulator
MSARPAKLEALLGRLDTAPAHDGYLRWINASRGADIQLITADEILFVQSDSKYTRVVHGGGESLIRKTIRELADELDPKVFWQVHRSTIVNLNAVAKVSRDANGRVILRLKDRDDVLQVSQPYAHLFRQM